MPHNRQPIWMHYMRSESRQELTTRAIALSAGDRNTPSTWDEATRSVEVVFATEQPVMIYDWDRNEYVPEVLLMSGVQLPPGNRMPLLDSHNRYSVGSQLGSNRDLRVESGQLIGRSHFADTATARDAASLVRDGHVTDWSVGYRVSKRDSVYVAAGATATVDGRSWSGPIMLRTKWTPKEASVTPIGADNLAKARTQSQSPVPPTQQRNPAMNHLRTLAIRHGMAESATEAELRTYAQTHLAELMRLASDEGDAQVRSAMLVELAKHTQTQAPPPPPSGRSGQPPAGVIQVTPADLQRMIAEQLEQAQNRADQDRQASIRTMAQTFGVPDTLRDEFMARSVDEAREAFKRHVLGAGHAAPHVGFAGLSITRDESDKFRAAALDGLALAFGWAPYDFDLRGEKVARTAYHPGAEQLAGLSTMELARECLLRSNVPVPHDRLELAGRAMTTSDFPIILENFANKALFEGYSEAPETWETWADVGTARDYRENKEAELGEVDDLEEVKENEEYPYGTMPEAYERWSLAKWGKMLSFTREMLLNDDLGAFRDRAEALGRTARRKEGDLVYGVLTANGNMGDGVPLFHATHRNLAVDGDVGTVAAKLAVAVKALMLQTGLGGETLNIVPTYLLAPVALMDSIEQHFGPYQPNTSTNVNVNRRFFGDADRRQYEARLDAVSATSWYLLGPRGKTVRLRHLQGYRRPSTERESEFSRDAVRLKLRHEITAHARSWRAAYANAGQ